MAENFAQLGKLFFTSTVMDYGATQTTLMPAPTATSTERGVYLVEHALINRAGLLQATGRKLKTRTINMTLRQNFCNVRDAIDYFSLMMYTYQPQPLIWGNGTFDGLYMIENISETDNEFFVNGALVACDLVISLKEFVDAKPLERIQNQNRDNAKAVGDKKTNVVRGRSNKATCYQNMARAMQVIEMHGSQVDKAVQAYANGVTRHDVIKAHLATIKTQVNQYSPYIVNDPESCIYHDYDLFRTSERTVATTNYLVEDLNANIIVPGSFSVSKLRTDNVQLQKAVRNLKTTMQPYINKTISRG